MFDRRRISPNSTGALFLLFEFNLLSLLLDFLQLSRLFGISDLLWGVKCKFFKGQDEVFGSCDGIRTGLLGSVL